MMKKKKKIVVIGGGTGLPVLLRGLKKNDVDITAIVTIADDGGSSGRLRQDLEMPPPGDIRNVLIALAEVEPLLEELFQYRFQNGDLSGHSLGNLMLAAMTDVTGDFAHATQEMSRVLNVRGKVLPSSKENVVLHAELEDGTIVTGESTLASYGKRIKRVFLTPEHVEPLSEAVEAIKKADLIVLGPGSLYTSILPNLLVSKISKTLIKAKGKKVYVCNVMTEDGETSGYTASDHVKALYDHVKTPFLDYVLVNKTPIPKQVVANYLLENAEPVKCDNKKLKNLHVNVIKKNLICYDADVIRHDTNKVASSLMELLFK